jgi:hypothetical protein
MKNKEKTPYKE